MVRPSGHNGKRRFYEAPFSIFCCAPLTLPCRQIKTPAFLFDWAAPQNFRICGIFFALTREISLAAVRQASGTCGAYLRFTVRKYPPYKFRASSSKNLAASAASRALRGFSQVMGLRSSTGRIRHGPQISALPALPVACNEFSSWEVPRAEIITIYYYSCSAVAVYARGAGMTE